MVLVVVVMILKVMMAYIRHGDSNRMMVMFVMAVKSSNDDTESDGKCN